MGHLVGKVGHGISTAVIYTGTIIKSTDSGQTLQNGASDQDLQCLLLI